MPQSEGSDRTYPQLGQYLFYIRSILLRSILHTQNSSMGGKVRSGVTEYVVLLLIGLETCSMWITDMDRYCGSIQQGQGQEHYCVQHAVATESTP